MKYRQKPVEVEAFQFTEDSEVYAPDWFLKEVQKEKIFIDRIIEDGFVRVYGCSIKISGGWIRAKVGDYIILQADKKISSCKKKDFTSMYEPIREEVEELACKKKGKKGKK